MSCSRSALDAILVDTRLIDRKKPVTAGPTCLYAAWWFVSELW